MSCLKRMQTLPNQPCYQTSLIVPRACFLLSVFSMIGGILLPEKSPDWVFSIFRMGVLIGFPFAITLYLAGFLITWSSQNRAVVAVVGLSGGAVLLAVCSLVGLGLAKPLSLILGLCLMILGL